MDEEEAVTTVIKSAVSVPEGHGRLAYAEEFLIGELERNRFKHRAGNRNLYLRYR